uniref:F-box domain-containing protein n=1 Tax=Oryza meridionalis TaxID=40149 RepID=A0A0E0C166_9ORYZ
MDVEIPSDRRDGDVDWSELPADLLVTVFTALEIPDLICCAAVCRSWRDHYYSSTRRLGLCRNSHGPCLLTTSPTGVATLHRLSTGKLYRIPLPDMPPSADTIFGNPYHHPLPGGAPLRDRYVVGSSHGWLVTADELSELHLLNPITGAQFPLPPLRSLAPVRLLFRKNDLTTFYGHSIRDITPRRPKHNPRVPILKYDAAETRYHLYQRAVLSGDPSSQGRKCTVVVIHNPWNLLSFARLGDATWTWLALRPDCLGYQDCFFDDDGLLYAVRSCGEIQTIDFNGSAPVVNCICVPLKHAFDRANYIVRAPWGDILLVWRSFELNDAEEPGTYELAVFKLDLATEDLVQIKDLRGHALFVSFGTSFFVSVNDFPVLTPNCVYLAHDSTKCRRFEHIAKEIRVYNLQDDTFADQYTQSSWKNCPPPALWVQPTCIRMEQSQHGNIEIPQMYGDIQLMPFVDYYTLITLKTIAISMCGSLDLSGEWV